MIKVTRIKKKIKTDYKILFYGMVFVGRSNFVLKLWVLPKHRSYHMVRRR